MHFCNVYFVVSIYVRLKHHSSFNHFSTSRQATATLKIFLTQTFHVLNTVSEGINYTQYTGYSLIIIYTIILLRSVDITNCSSQSLLDRLGRCLKLSVSTDTSSHEFTSQFGLAIFVYAKNTQKLSRRLSLTQVSVEYAGHGRSIASDNMTGDNSDHSGKRLRQNGEKQQVKTATTRVYTLASRLEKCGLGIIT